MLDNVKAPPLHAFDHQNLDPQDILNNKDKPVESSSSPSAALSRVGCSLRPLRERRRAQPPAIFDSCVGVVIAFVARFDNPPSLAREGGVPRRRRVLRHVFRAFSVRMSLPQSSKRSELSYS